MEFKVGDRVVYTGKYKIASGRYIDKEGSVVKVGRPYPTRPQEQIYDVLFDLDITLEGNHIRRMYLANLELVNRVPDWEV